MRAKLIVVGGKANRAEIRLKLPAIVGRSRKAGIVIDHHTVSRQHCELFEEEGKIFVRDLGSLNGTHVGGDQVQRALLEHGTELSVGPLTFRLDYDHLANTPAPAASPADDAVLPDAPTVAPELAETVVNMPRIARPEPLEELVDSSLPDAPLVDLGDDDGFDLDLPADQEPIASAAEAVEESAEPLDLLGSDDDSFDQDLESPLAAAEAIESEPIAAETPDEILAADDDDLGFDLSPMPELEDIAPAVVEKRPEPPAAIEPAKPADDDDFLAMMSEETVVIERPAAKSQTVDEAPEAEPAPVAKAETSPSSAPDDDDFLAMMTEETIVVERPPAPPADDAELSFDEPDEVAETTAAALPATNLAEHELDWLDAEEPPQGAEPADVDINELAANMPLDPSTVMTESIDEIEELEFDEPTVESAEAAPQVETPPPAKKKRSMWPFGRKKKAAAEAPAETTSDVVDDDVVEALEIAAELPVAETLGAETIVMGALDLEEVESPSAEAEPIVDISLTQEFSHEKTVVIDDAVELIADEAPATLVEKPKRGLFGRGRKAKAAEAVAATPAEAPVAAAEELVDAVVEEAEVATKKRGWWPFSKKTAAKSAQSVAEESPAAATPSKTAPVAATASSPSPESFEFSDEELLEITAEGTPPTPAAALDPQALAADEVLDFELDLPLEDSSGNIAPVLSDAPAPATGADDDDFLDFLSEELPGAKPKRGG